MKAKQVHRLKIVEQITIVLLFSVIVPLIISWLIINNINQQAVRKELKNTALMLSLSVKNTIEGISESNINKLKEMALALRYIPTAKQKQIYLNDILINNKNYKELKIIDPKNSLYSTMHDDEIQYDISNKLLILTEKSPDGSYIRSAIDIKSFENLLFNLLKDDNRQVYILDENKNLILAHNISEGDLNLALQMLPKKLQVDEAIVYGNKKNQPLVYYKMNSPDLLIIVDTTEEITGKTITKARNRIVLAFIITGLAIIFVVGMYTYYLYINIRQLIKGIIALSKGSYKRKIRLLINVFTPFEIVFLASEFNRMGDEIYKTYKVLKHKNKELKLLDEFRSNLIDTVSHEFRTPLTSIKGYTSRLLRTDIEIDETTKIKSLKIIKRQAERLTTMVEDLLVIPDIEGAKLRIDLEKIDLTELIETSTTAVLKDFEKELIIKIPNDLSPVYTDKNRLEQILINLLENAKKYSYEKTPIIIKAVQDNFFVSLIIQNQADYIQKETLNKLFEKFTRIDDKTTRTTRGTGLGLFIVKGLVETMKGSVRLYSTKNNLFEVVLNLPIYNKENSDNNAQ